MPRARRFLFEPRNLPRASRAASRSGQVVQYSRKPLLHRGQNHHRSTRGRSACNDVGAGHEFPRSRQGRSSRRRRRLAPPARIELATLALGKPCSIQLSYGGGRRNLSRPWPVLKLCRGFRYILRVGARLERVEALLGRKALDFESGSRHCFALRLPPLPEDRQTPHLVK